MSNEKQTGIAKAAEKIANGERGPSIDDVAPDGALELAGKPVLPLNGSTIRFVQAVSRVEEMSEEEIQWFCLWCSVKGAEDRRKMWRLARDPVKMYDAFIGWVDELPGEEARNLMEEFNALLVDYDDATEIVSGGEGADSDDANPTTS